MFWKFFTGIAKQVRQYSTMVGQMWYILTFVFRLIVAATFGTFVFANDEAASKCEIKIEGCSNECYSQVVPVSYLFFWAVQMLSVTAPVVAFHFLVTYFAGEREKNRNTEATFKNNDNEANCSQYERFDDENRPGDNCCESLMTNRCCCGLNKISFHDKMRFAYFISIILRLIAEVMLLILFMAMYDYQSPEEIPGCNWSSSDESNSNSFNSDCFNMNPGMGSLLPDLPKSYLCSGADLSDYCRQGRYVPINHFIKCTISRAWEKSDFLKYMNGMSVTCLCLCVVEMIVVPIQYLCNRRTKKRVATLTINPNNLEMTEQLEA